jgi:hypothetical protein
VKALLGGAKRVMLSLAEEASPLGTAAGAIVAVCVGWRKWVGEGVSWVRDSRSVAEEEERRIVIGLSQMASTRIVWWDWEQQESVDDRHWSS